MAEPVHFEQTQDGFALLRGSKPLATPAERALVVPSKVVAERIAAEYAYLDTLRAVVLPDPAKLPFLQLAATSIDKTSRARKDVIQKIIAYAETEMLCYRALEPEALVMKQNELWQPYLDWAEADFGLSFTLAAGVMPLTQPSTNAEKLKAILQSYDNFTLTGLAEAVSVSGSMVLGLALVTGYTSVDAIFAAAECDSLFQMSLYGEDPVTLAKHEDIRRDLKYIREWAQYLRSL